MSSVSARDTAGEGSPGALSPNEPWKKLAVYWTVWGISAWGLTSGGVVDPGVVIVLFVTALCGVVWLFAKVCRVAKRRSRLTLYSLMSWILVPIILAAAVWSAVSLVGLRARVGWSTSELAAYFARVESGKQYAPGWVGAVWVERTERSESGFLLLVLGQESYDTVGLLYLESADGNALELTEFQRVVYLCNGWWYWRRLSRL